MISTSIIAAFAFYAILPALFVTAVLLVCRGRMKISVRNIAIGAAVFFLFSQVLEKFLHAYMLALNTSIASWLKDHPYGYALYACLAAGVFEEVGRYLAMRFVVKDTGNPGTAVGYGLGHGGIEAVLLGSMSLIATVVFAIMLKLGYEVKLSAMLGPEGLAQLKAALEYVPHGALLLSMLERLIALLIQVGLSVLVWRAVQTRRLALLAIAIAVHAAIDFPVGLVQAGQLSGTVVMGWLLLIGAAIAAWFLYRLPRKSTALVASA